MSDSIRLSSVTVNCPDAPALARFYAEIADGSVTVAQQEWATVQTPGGRIDLQAVDGYRPPDWPGQDGSALVHLDFLVDDLQAASHRVTMAGARQMGFQPNQEHCLVFADPVGNPFCLTLWDEIG